MAKYIEKAAILSKCEEMWNNADETTQTGVDTINAIDRITDFIEAMPAANVQPMKWISVNDRLPENNKLVLCYAQSTTGEGCCYILGTLSNDEFWFLQAHDGHHLSFPNLHLVVTHWQPLPEPPVNP